MMRRAIILLLLLMTAIVNNMPAGKQTKPTLEFIRKSYETRFSDPVKFDIRLNDSSGVPVEGVYIDVYLNTTDQVVRLGSARTNASGIATMTVPRIDVPPGTYQVKATCNCEGYDLVATAELIVDKELTKIVLLDQNITVEYSDNASISARILTDDDEPISNASVTLIVFVGSTILKFQNISDENGYLHFQVPTVGISQIVVGEYDIVLSFDGNDYYEPTTYKAAMNVIEEQMIIRVSTIGKMVVGASIILLVQVLDNDGSPVSFAEVRIFIDGEIVGIGRTDSQGIYEYSWKLSSAGNHTVIIKVMKQYYKNASYVLPIVVEGKAYGEQLPTVFIAILLFLIIAVVIAYFSRR